MTEPVEVWLIRTDVAEAGVAALAATLEPDERRRADTFVDPAERRRFVVAHGAVRELLGRRLGVAPGDLRWRYGPAGKPELPDGPQVNLSHSGQLAMLAVHPHRAVGVDVQHLLPAATAVRLAHRFFPAAEARLVAEDDHADRFAVLWTRREAWVKAAGGELLHNLAVPVAGPTPRVVDTRAGRFTVRDVPAPDGYRAAVALAGADPFEMSPRGWP